MRRIHGDGKILDAAEGRFGRLAFMPKDTAAGLLRHEASCLKAFGNLQWTSVLVVGDPDPLPPGTASKVRPVVVPHEGPRVLDEPNLRGVVPIVPDTLPNRRGHECARVGLVGLEISFGEIELK